MRCPALHELPPPPADKQGWPWTVAAPRLPALMPQGGVWPKITLVTPSYHQGAFLEETIRSVLLQGYPNLEYMIMDGGSTDNSVAIIQQYAPWLTAWVSERDQGQAHAINKGFQRATGEWLGWLNSDDCYTPDALANLMTAAQRDKANFVHGACTHFGPDLATAYMRQPLPEAFRPEILCLTMEFDQPACLWQRALFAQVGPLNEQFTYAFDWEFFIKCAPHLRLASLADNVAFYRHHADHKSGGGGWKRLNELLTIYAAHLPRQEHRAFRYLWWSYWVMERIDRVRNRSRSDRFYRLCSRLIDRLDEGLQRHHRLHPLMRLMFGLPAPHAAIPARYLYPVPGLA